MSLIFEGRIAKNLFEKSTQGQRISLRKSHEKIILLIPESVGGWQMWTMLADWPVKKSKVRKNFVEYESLNLIDSS